MLPIGITFTPDNDSASNTIDIEYIEIVEKLGGLPIPLFLKKKEVPRRYL